MLWSYNVFTNVPLRGLFPVRPPHIYDLSLRLHPFALWDTCRSVSVTESFPPVRAIQVIYLTPWWSWRPAWPATRPRRSWSPPLVSWMCDVSWADCESPGNGPGRWSTCALCSRNTRARRMSRIRCTTPRRAANTLKTRRNVGVKCVYGTSPAFSTRWMPRPSLLTDTTILHRGL